MKACADETQNECKTERSTSCTMEKVTHCKEKHKKQCDMMGQKWDMVREFISQSGDTMNDETRTRLQRLEAFSPVGKGAAIFSPGAGLRLSPVHEDSTCSILGRANSVNAANGGFIED